MTKLIINADDFGYSKAVNLGIVEAYQNGVVTSATMMTNMPGAAHAAALALENPGLGVGVHLVLDCGSPVCENVPSLVDEKGNFLKAEAIEQFAEIADIETEYRYQIERVFALGLKPTHIDSHHHLHSHPKIYPLVEKIAGRYGLPIRKIAADLQHTSNVNLPTAPFFIHDFYGSDLTSEYFIELLNSVLPYETAEIMTHPAYIDEPLLKGSSYALQRVRELAILTDNRVQKAIADNKIELVTYAEIANQFFV